MAYRLGRVERDTEILSEKKADKDFVEQLVNALENAVQAQVAEVRGLRRVIVGAAGTVTTSALVATITMLATHFHA